MYAIFTYMNTIEINHSGVHVGKYTSLMDGMGHVTNCFQPISGHDEQVKPLVMHGTSSLDRLGSEDGIIPEGEGSGKDREDHPHPPIYKPQKTAIWKGKVAPGDEKDPPMVYLSHVSKSWGPILQVWVGLGGSDAEEVYTTEFTN